MKKQKITGLIALFLCFSLLAACAPGAEPGAEPEQILPPESEPTQHSDSIENKETKSAESQQQTAAPESAAPEATEPEELYTGEAEVIALYRGEGETAYGVTTEISYPYIDLPGKEMAALNLEFLQDYMKYVNEDGVFEINKAPSHSYKWYVNGDILSLVIEEQGFARRYRVYNIRISTCKLIEANEVLAAAGVTKEDFYGQARDILGNAYYTDNFLSYLDTSDEGTSDLYYPWLHERVIAEAISDENVSRCIPYLNENGELCFGGWIYIDVGAEWHGVSYSWDLDNSLSPLYIDYLERNELTPYKQ